jgi:hypothetical protein
MKLAYDAAAEAFKKYDPMFLSQFQVYCKHMPLILHIFVLIFIVVYAPVPYFILSMMM